MFFVIDKNLTLTRIRKLKSDFHITGVILSNTRDINDKILKELGECNCFIHFGHLTRIPIINKYENHQTLGKDRLAACIGARKYFSEGNCLVIDMGTCITSDFLSDQNEFIGGNISPGIKLRLRAMNAYTDKLPLADIFLPENMFGNNTIEALQNGAVKGTLYEIDTFINLVLQKKSPINVMLTGGDAHYFENYTKNKIFVAPNLVLEGLNEILRYNAY